MFRCLTKRKSSGRRDDAGVRAGLLMVLLGLSASGCFRPNTTVRVMDGVEIEGRRIAPEAYAAYFRGVLLERRGQLDKALEKYMDALDEDPNSVELWTSVGRVRCRLRASRTWYAFEQAEGIDPSFEPLWRERARCYLANDNPRAALEAATIATGLDPTSEGATDVAVEALNALGRSQEGARWRAALSLEVGSRSKESESEAAPVPPRQVLDDALRRGALDEARALAVEHRVDRATLALRALELGLTSIAQDQAELVGSAAPNSSDAHIALLIATGPWQTARNEDGQLKLKQIWNLLEQAPSTLETPSPLAQRLLWEFLEDNGLLIQWHSQP